MPVLNWCYGASQPTENLAVVNEQLVLAHRYKNTLVELELKRREESQKLARLLHPDFDTSVIAYEKADSQVDAAYEELRNERIKARKRVEPSPAVSRKIEDAKAARQVAAEQMNETKSIAYGKVNDLRKLLRDRATAETTTRPGEKPARHKRRIFARYNELLLEHSLSGGEVEFAEACLKARKETETYWGTYLPIEDATKEFREGAPPKFRRYTGNGSVASQLQKGRTLARVLSGKDTLLRIVLPEITERMAMKGKDRGKQARAVAFVRVASDEKKKPIFAKIPFTYHREIPTDSIIKWAFIDRKIVGTKESWKLRLVIETKRERKNPDNGEMVTVHVGHRMVPAGMRVATVLNGESFESLVIPREEVKAYAYTENLESIRKTTFNAAIDALIEWMKATDVPDWFKEDTETILHWKSPDRLNRLISKWRHNRFDADACDADAMQTLKQWTVAKEAEYRKNKSYRPKNHIDLETVFGVMEFWRRFDNHLCDWIANHSRKFTARRENLYRKFASDLGKKYSTLAIAKVKWDELRETPKFEKKDETSTEIRRLASIGSPGRLCEILREVFNGRTKEVPAKDITRVHSGCGNIHEFDRTLIRTTCCHCGAEYDQDENAAINTQKRAESGVLVVKEEKKKKVRRNRKSPVIVTSGE